MAACAYVRCPALATKGDFCPVHAVAALRAVCAWCKVVIREGMPGGDVSHGICPDCAGAFEGLTAEAAEERAAAVATRERIAALYHKPGRHTAAAEGVTA